MNTGRAMRVNVQFFSYFKELAGGPAGAVDLAEGATLREGIDAVLAAHPRLEPMRKSMLVAVGVEYRPRDHILKPGDDLSFFPPVQGG